MPMSVTYLIRFGPSPDKIVPGKTGPLNLFSHL